MRTACCRSKPGPGNRRRRRGTCPAARAAPPQGFREAVLRAPQSTRTPFAAGANRRRRENLRNPGSCKNVRGLQRRESPQSPPTERERPAPRRRSRRGRRPRQGSLRMGARPVHTRPRQGALLSRLGPLGRAAPERADPKPGPGRRVRLPGPCALTGPDSGTVKRNTPLYCPLLHSNSCGPGLRAGFRSPLAGPSDDPGPFAAENLRGLGKFPSVEPTRCLALPNSQCRLRVDCGGPGTTQHAAPGLRTVNDVILYSRASRIQTLDSSLLRVISAVTVKLMSLDSKNYVRVAYPGPRPPGAASESPATIPKLHSARTGLRLR